MSLSALKFKVGDKVKVVRSNYQPKDAFIGTITEIANLYPHQSAPYKTTTNAWMWRETELELVTPDTATEPQAVKVGDWVHFGDGTIGQVETISVRAVTQTEPHKCWTTSDTFAVCTPEEVAAIKKEENEKKEKELLEKIKESVHAYEVFQAQKETAGTHC